MDFTNSGADYSNAADSSKWSRFQWKRARSGIIMIRGKKEPKSDSRADSRPGIITALDRGDYHGGEGVESTKQPPNQWL